MELASINIAHPKYLLQLREKIRNDIALVIHVIESKGHKVIVLIGRGIDLNATKECQATSLGVATSNNLSNQNILTLIQSEGELLHAVLGILETLSVGKDELLDGTLLEVRKCLKEIDRRRKKE